MQRLIHTWLAALLLLGAAAVFAQEKGAAPAKDAAISYGRVKTWEAGKKMVIDVASAGDKTFDLTDNNYDYTISKTLKTGDAVMIAERMEGAKKQVSIEKDTAKGKQRGKVTK